MTRGCGRCGRGFTPEHLLGSTTGFGEPVAAGALMQAFQSANLGAYSYAVSLVALDQRDAYAQPFLGFLAARLAVPASVVRSVRRRHRMTVR